MAAETFLLLREGFNYYRDFVIIRKCYFLSFILREWVSPKNVKSILSLFRHGLAQAWVGNFPSSIAGIRHKLWKSAQEEFSGSLKLGLPTTRLTGYKTGKFII
jgi:hypothetical protein